MTKTIRKQPRGIHRLDPPKLKLASRILPEAAIYLNSNKPMQTIISRPFKSASLVLLLGYCLILSCHLLPQRIDAQGGGGGGGGDGLGDLGLGNLGLGGDLGNLGGSSGGAGEFDNQQLIYDK